MSNSKNEKPPFGYLEKRARIITDPSTSYWLREALVSLEKRDPVDALQDIETLNLLTHLRAVETLGEPQ